MADDKPLRRRAYFGALASALVVPRWMAPFFGSLGETLARSLRLSNRKLREASGWSPKYPAVREGFAAAAAGLDPVGSGTGGGTGGRS